MTEIKNNNNKASFGVFAESNIISYMLLEVAKHLQTATCGYVDLN